MWLPQMHGEIESLKLIGFRHNIVFFHKWLWDWISRINQF